MTGRLRHVARWLWAALLFATGRCGAARRGLRRRGAIVVLAFHRVLNDEQFVRTQSLSGMVMRRRTFERLSAYASGRYEVADVSHQPMRECGRLEVAFTFDDGWLDNYTVVFPIVRAHRIPITVFVCPGLLERETPFWPEQVAASMRSAIPGVSELQIENGINRLKRSPSEVQYGPISYDGDAPGGGPDWTMTWEQIEEMNAAGVAVGAHTQTHQLLTRLDEAEGRRELAGCKASLERRLSRPCYQFAYPNGNQSEQTRRLLAEAGFTQAFTMERSAWTSACDPLAIPRVNMAEDDVTGPDGGFSAAMFEYTSFWKVARTMRKNGEWH